MLLETPQLAVNQHETTTERSVMQAEIIEETLADGTVVQEEPVIQSITKHNSDGSVEVIPVPQQISLGRKKHSGVKKNQFIQIWNREDIITLKDFCATTGLSENCARVRSYQYSQQGEMLKKLAMK